MTRIQNRGLGDQIDSDVDHIDMRNIERSHFDPAITSYPGR